MIPQLGVPKGGGEGTFLGRRTRYQQHPRLVHPIKGVGGYIFMYTYERLNTYLSLYLSLSLHIYIYTYIYINGVPFPASLVFSYSVPKVPFGMSPEVFLDRF